MSESHCSCKDDMIHKLTVEGRAKDLRINQLETALNLALEIFTEHKIGGGRVECLCEALGEPKLNPAKKFVILKGLREGNRFFSTNSEEDPRYLVDGTLAYKILGYADTVEEAQIKLYGRASKALRPSLYDL